MRQRSDKLKRKKEPRDHVNPRGPQLRENLQTQRIKKMNDKFPTLRKTNSRVFKRSLSKNPLRIRLRKSEQKGAEKHKKGDQCSCFQRERLLQHSGIHYRGALIIDQRSGVHSRGAPPFPKT
jgi:hypothetical protein